MTNLMVRRVLIVDDVPANRLKYAALVLRGIEEKDATGSRPVMSILPEVAVAASTDHAISILQQARDQGRSFDVLVTDLFMKPLDGLALIRGLHDKGFTPDDLEVVLLSSEKEAKQRENDIGKIRQLTGRESHGMEVVLRGQSDSEQNRQSDPHGADDEEFLQAVWKSIWDKLAKSATRAIVMPQSNTVPAGNWLDNYPTRHKPLIARVARIIDLLEKGWKGPVYISGPTAVGKSTLAKVLSDAINVPDDKYVRIDFAAFPEDLRRSQLLGYEKNAFTGALERHLGLVERAQGGVLFIDEIADVSPDLLVALHAVLDGQNVYRVGGTEPIPKGDFLLITATNRNLERLVEDGTFREDTYRRLVKPEGTIAIPPLSERPEDIEAIALWLWKRAGRTEPWETKALASLTRRNWPFNVDELNASIQLLKVTHPKGNPVSEAAIEQLNKDIQPVVIYGLEHQRSTVSRFYHVAFQRALSAAFQEKKLKNMRGMDIKKTFIKHVFTQYQPIFESEERVQMVWSEHSQNCRQCNAVWEQLSA